MESRYPDRRARIGLQLFGVILVIAIAVVATTAQRGVPRRATPLEPISAVLDAFRLYDVVGLGEHHPASKQLNAFRLALVRDPQFTTTVGDIVVEAGDASNQELIDRFTRLEDVPPQSLAQLGYTAAYWDPAYRDFFAAIRETNAALPLERKVRVWLADSPHHQNRAGAAADLIRREVLAHGRRALVLYGDTFFMRKDPVAPEGSHGTWDSITRDLEHAGARVFTVWVNGCTDLARLQPDVASWPRPSLTILAGTVLGATDFARYRRFGDWRRENGRPILVDGQPVIDPPRPGLRMEEQFDALLSLDSPDRILFGSTMTRCG